MSEVVQDRDLGEVRAADKGDDPDMFDVGRYPEHQAFDAEHHSCLGTALARPELRAMFERFPDMRIGGTPRWATAISLGQLTGLPVALNA